MKVHAGLPMLAAAVLLAACGAAAPSQPASSPSSGAPGATASPSLAVVPSPAESAVPTVSQAPTASPPAGPDPTPAATPSPRPAATPPAKPTRTTIKMGGTASDITTTITWAAPDEPGTEIRVYGVTSCHAKADPGPCLVPGTRLSSKELVLIAKAPADAGKVAWTWPAWDDIGWAVAADSRGTYDSIVVAAYNAAGHSKFEIVATGQYCSGCTY